VQSHDLLIDAIRKDIETEKCRIYLCLCKYASSILIGYLSELNEKPQANIDHPMYSIKGPSLSSHQRYPSKSRRKTNKAKQCREEQRAIHPVLITTKELSRIKKDLNDNYHLRLHTATPTLPPSFFSLFENIRTLDLRKVGLQILPPQIIQLKNLQKLDLRYNNLTYLPSQIAQLPNLHQLQMEDVRGRKDKLLKAVDVITNDLDNEETEICSCTVLSDAQKIPPLPTLGQLCTRAIFCTIPIFATDDSEGLSWEELEPFYKTGKFEEIPNQALPFPSHLFPTYIPIDICSACFEPVFPIYAQFDKIQVVVLCRVLLRYVFCSHICYYKFIEQQENERVLEEERKRLRRNRFCTIKDQGYVTEI